MPEHNNPPTGGGQPDFAAMLAVGKASKLDVLLKLSPAEPLADLDQQTIHACTPAELAKARKRAAALAEEFPGYQAAYWKREQLKYGNTPRDGAPLDEYVAARLRHARALWSRSIDGEWTKLQFADWLPLHVDWRTETPPLWPDHPGWCEALEMLRLTYGLPRLPPTELNPSPLAAPDWAFHPRHIRMMSGAPK